MSGVQAVVVYQRSDGRWAWRAVASNGQVVASDGGQGYENRGDCADEAYTVTGVVPIVERRGRDVMRLPRWLVRLALLFPPPPVLAGEHLRRWDDDPLERLGSWPCCGHCRPGCDETHRTPCSYTCPARERS